jgi:VanZ family protein
VAILIRFWFPLLVYSGIIFYVSSIPSLEAPAPFPQADKFFHVGMYFPFGFLAIRAMTGAWPAVPVYRAMLAALALTALYAVSDEIHQMFVPGRSASPDDVFADVIGGIFGILAFRFLFPKLEKS